MRTFFQYCIDNYMLLVAFLFQVGLGLACLFLKAPGVAIFFGVIFVITLMLAYNNWKKNG